MKLTPSFFQSLDEWIENFETNEPASIDCPDYDCADECSFPCIPDPLSEFLESPYVNIESPIWRLEALEEGGPQWHR
ncbi:MAG: hypothetical protein NPINA01_02740 [Nitrospinaceae bacterium]|nr:MAG: hypothetical protein NPINA01_02740 [Nitrospinaceae bacterium]